MGIRLTQLSTELKIEAEHGNIDLKTNLVTQKLHKDLDFSPKSFYFNMVLTINLPD